MWLKMAAYMKHFLPCVSQVVRITATRRLSQPAPAILTSLLSYNGGHCMMTQTRCFAARTGTREKKLKLKKARKLLLQARAAQKDRVTADVSRRNKASKSQLPSRQRTLLDPTKTGRVALDDVWISSFYKRQMKALKEAIEMYRESHHPTVMNLPNAPLYLSLELDMSSEKKNKVMDNFNGVIRPPHFFDDGKTKTVIAFSKDDASQQQAMDAGADMVGGTQLIKRVQGGEALLADYKYIVAHANILIDLNPLRGIMKKRFPNSGKGTVGLNMETLVEHFKKGIEYASERDSVQPNFGWVDVQVGELNMPTEHIGDNVREVISAVCSQRNLKIGPFVTVAVLTCPPSKEKIIIDVDPFLPSVPLDESDEDEAAEKIG